jgi:hypothetical protein
MQKCNREPHALDSSRGGGGGSSSSLSSSLCADFAELCLEILEPELQSLLLLVVAVLAGGRVRDHLRHPLFQQLLGEFGLRRAKQHA